MKKLAVILFSLMLFPLSVCALGKGDIEIESIDENQWQVSLHVDGIENVFGLQAEFEFKDLNAQALQAQFNHVFDKNRTLGEKNKMVLLNIIESHSAKYAVSLVRPEKPVELEGDILSFKVALKENKPSYIKLKTLKVSDERGNVTKFDISGSSFLIGEATNYIFIYVLSLGLFVMLCLVGLFLKRKSIANNPPITV